MAAQRAAKRGWRAAIVLVALTIVMTGCDWASFGNDAGNTRYSSFEKSITPANAANLTLAWQLGLGSSSAGAPVVAGGRVFVSANGRLQVFDAATGAPRWSGTYSYPGGTPAVDGSRVYVGGSGGIWVFDVAGPDTSCAGTAPNRTCNPLFVLVGPGTGTTGNAQGLLITAGSVYFPTQGSVLAWDADGGNSCAVSAGQLRCQPKRRYTGMPSNAISSAPPAAAGNVLYATYGSTYAWSLDGSQGCDQSGVCTPLRRYVYPVNTYVYAAPVVADGSLYIADWYANLWAFDATGQAGCTTDSVPDCSPTWHISTGYGTANSPAVADGVVVLSSQGGDGVRAFDGRAADHPLLWSWSGATNPYVHGASPAIAGDVVVTTSSVGATEVFDRACPATCAPLKTLATGPSGYDSTTLSPTVANGTIYVVQNDQLYAFRVTSP